MMETNAILVVDDDPDDVQMIQEAAATLNLHRPILIFANGDALKQYLNQSESTPFLILCDVNLPRESGFELHQAIAKDKKLKYKSVPFIFWSTDASEKQIQYAYDLPAQGFFFKPGNFGDLCTTLRTILTYWQTSQHPKKLG